VLYLFPTRYDLVVQNASASSVNIHLVTPFPSWDEAWYHIPPETTLAIKGMSSDPGNLDRLVLLGQDCVSLRGQELYPSSLSATSELLIDVDGTIELGDIGAVANSYAPPASHCGG
jgi:hypothetical protein